ncbi:hypothetical protein WJX73_009410 [Symbiochloris irregularis]|uniref:Gamma-butyrobetaine hydroxylase-like N-terminal domain-containing protein n=1 Tax=Symbiochloris irregularis TaxID=706552 RepID=A0AAW1NU86_9CHLO
MLRRLSSSAQRLIPTTQTPVLQKSPITATDILLLRQNRELEVSFSDGAVFRYSSELLRVESPAANSKSKAAGRTLDVVAGRRHVAILGLEAVGSYASG